MENVSIPADNVPDGLKACEQILKRAKELKKSEPVIAYWCKSDDLGEAGADIYRLFLGRSDCS
jgi:hypothetical protein